MRLTAWCLCRLVLMAGANALQHSPSNDERANALYAAPLNVCCESHGMVHGVMSVFYTLCITTVKVLLSLQERAPPPVGQGGRGYLQAATPISLSSEFGLREELHAHSIHSLAGAASEESCYCCCVSCHYLSPSPQHSCCFRLNTLTQSRTRVNSEYTAAFCPEKQTQFHQIGRKRCARDSCAPAHHACLRC